MSGRITTILGAMGAGKTERLIQAYTAYTSMGLDVKVYKPRLDTRVGGDFVKSRSGATAPATSIDRIDEIFLDGDHPNRIVLIDEIQFFDHLDVVNSLVALSLVGHDIYCYGLDLTSDGVTFGSIGDILAVSDEVSKITCTCVRCGVKPARHSAYLGGEKDSVVVVGDLDSYEPVCRDCFYAEEVKEFLDSDEDPLYFIEIGTKELGFTMELIVAKSSLEKAGYTYEEVLEITTLEGASNLVDDLGLSERGDPNE